MEKINFKNKIKSENKTIETNTIQENNSNYYKSDLLMSVDIKGGIGNILFQVFTLISTGLDKNINFVFDDKFNNGRMSIDNIFINISKNDINNHCRVKEQGFTYSPLSLQNKSNILLDGYFQSYKYFYKNMEKIKLQYLNRIDVQTEYMELYNKYNLKTVALHIRRGDYLNHNKIYEILDSNYYWTCINNFDINQYHFIIFCENEDFADLELNKLPWKTIVTNQYSDDYKTMLIMSKCDNFIIANSTYSLWSMYLSDNIENKQKFIPYHWFKNTSNINFDIFEIFPIDLNTTIVNNRNKNIISRTYNNNINIVEYNNYDYENSLYYIGKNNENYYQIDNLNKTKCLINFPEYLQECKENINQIKIYNINSENILNYQDIDNNDIFLTVFIIGYNCSKWIRTSVKSVSNQNYKNYEIIYLNPQSTDDTRNIVSEILSNQSIPYYIVDNEPRKYQTENFFTITKLARKNSVLVSVDGDDWLKGSNVLKTISKAYYATNCLMTYGLYEEVPLRYVNEHWKEIPSNILDDNNIRPSNMRTSHLRTWMRELLLCVNENDTKFDNKFQPVCGDLSVLYPMIELAGNKICYIKKENYCYNTTNQNSDAKTNQQLQLKLDDYYRTKCHKYNKINNVWFLINSYYRNLSELNPEKVKKALLLDLLRPSNAKLSLFQNNCSLSNFYNNINIKLYSDNVFISKQISGFESLYYDYKDYENTMNINNLNKYTLNHLSDLKIFENNYILNNLQYYFIANKEIDYEWNIIIPYLNRYDNLKCLIKNLKEKVSPRLNVIITVVEISDGPTLQNDYQNNFNYIWVGRHLTGNMFNKCLCGNLTYKLYQNVYKYKYILWHDVDCVVQSNFVPAVLNKANENKCVQTFPNRYVLYTKEPLANKVRNGEVNIDSINLGSSGVDKPVSGAPGGSILIPKNIFEKMEYFNTNVFYNYSCEDANIMEKVKKYSSIDYVDQDNNFMIHLYHPPLGLKPWEKNPHFFFQESFEKIYTGNK